MNWISISIPVILMGAVSFYVGVYHLWLYLKRRKELLNLSFSLTCFSVGFYNFFSAGLYNSTSVLQGMFWQKFQLASIAILAITMTWFIHHFTGKLSKKLLYGISGWFFSLFILGIFINNCWTLSLINQKPKVVKLNNFINITYYEADPGIIYIIQFITMFFGFLYLIIILAKHIWGDNNKTGRPILFAIIVYFISAIVDLLIASGIIIFIYTTEYVFLLIILSMAYVLLDRFVNLHIEVEDLNKNLEQKVYTRTEELHAAMEEMEAINDRLIDTNHSLDFVNKIADKDMNMAKNIQQSLFIQEPPDLNDWDLAFYFKPMTGVSGDLYDFYFKDETLQGVVLLDVSGHGIASGLITMIARTIFHRIFYKMKNRHLNEMVEKANKHLILEIGNIDNYLTGIVLRLSENKVEYVNAGHPDIYLKKSNTGNVEAVIDKSSDHRGHFLGFKSMEEPYETFKFLMDKGDTLLLFTDCLLESKGFENSDDFEEKRVIKSLSNSAGKTSKEILNDILSDFNKFTDNGKLEDDLTIIVLQKK